MVAVHRVVADPRHPLGALTDLVEHPQDLEELLALRAITDPIAADALESISLVPPADRYAGRRAAIVMAPFLHLGASRFSPGTYGVLYTSDARFVAVRESGYHATRTLLATHMTSPTTLPRYALELVLDESRHRDVRRGGAHDVNDPTIYDPDPEHYGPAQALGNALRGAGHQGVCYDSVRAPGGTCFGTFRPAAVADVGDAVTELELVWDGSKIAECREITTHLL